MEDMKYEVYSKWDDKGYTELDFSIWKGKLGIHSEIDDKEFESEVIYSLTEEETNKLFNLLTVDDLIELGKNKGLYGIIQFLEKNGIKYEIKSIF